MLRVRSTHAVLVLVVLALALPAVAGTTTNSSDNLRTGWYPDQPFVPPSVVNNATFGKIADVAINGQVYAQPLYANGVLLVATETNWIYGIDPDSGLLMWSRQVAVPWNASDIGCGDLTPTIGITGTPVINEATNTAYFVAKTYASGTSGPAAVFMHAIDLTSGTEKAGWPVQIQGNAQNNAALAFNPFRTHQRPGLLLLDGVVYAAFGSHCDFGPWQGWVAGVSEAGQLKALWTTMASGTTTSGAAIWAGGAGLVSDGAGRIFFATGNGGASSTARAGNNPLPNCGECVERLAVQADGTLRAVDFFSPSNATNLDAVDLDLGSGGPIALPSAYFGTATYPNLLAHIGKQGVVLMMNRDNLGGIKQAPGSQDNVITKTGPYGGIWGRPAIWPGDGGYMYVAESGVLRAHKYQLDGTGKPSFATAGTSTENFAFSASSPIITSDGTTSGSALVWVVWMNNGGGTGAELRAYDTLPVGGTVVKRWSAAVGTATKFGSVGVAKNRLWVGTRDGHLLGFGTPATSVTVTKTAGAVHVAWTGGAAPFTLRRSEDGKFTVNVTKLVDKQPATAFDDPVLNDGKNYFYLVN